jgi:hypothetical protein
MRTERKLVFFSKRIPNSCSDGDISENAERQMVHIWRHDTRRNDTRFNGTPRDSKARCHSAFMFIIQGWRHYAECHYRECRGVKVSPSYKTVSLLLISCKFYKEFEHLIGLHHPLDGVTNP